MAATFENVQRADDVALDVGMRVFYRVANTGLRGKVNDLVESLVRKQGFHRITVGEIDAHHLEFVVIVQHGRTRFFQADIVIVIEIIEANDGVAALEQLL